MHQHSCSASCYLALMQERGSGLGLHATQVAESCIRACEETCSSSTMPNRVLRHAKRILRHATCNTMPNAHPVITHATYCTWGVFACTCCRWVEQQPPMLPAKVFRKVQDDGRADFTLSRTRANWRRLTLLRDATAPARQLFSHLCSWGNPWHSGGWYGVILLFGVYPSRVSEHCGDRVHSLDGDRGCTVLVGTEGAQSWAV